MHRSIRRALVPILLALAPALMANPRQPLGVYAVVNVNEYISNYEKTNPSPTTADIETYFNGTVYPGLFANQAVSGIALYITWASLNPNPPSDPNPYYWNLLQDLFDQVALWNSNNSNQAPKTIQLVVTPGFNSPPWLLNQINSCDFLFDRRIPKPTSGQCGRATFWGFKEGGDTGGVPSPMSLPMPWDPAYKSAWQAFLTVLAGKYGSNPSLVSIAVAGPTASSEEMILPSTQSIDPNATQLGGLTPERMWDILLAHFFTNPALLQTDQAVIDEWRKAIDMFGTVFSGLTLVVTTGDGLPNLTTCLTTKSTCTFTYPTDPITDFATVCPVANMDCAAETTILEYFKKSTVGGANAKAVQTDGMKGSGSDAFNLGVPGVQRMSETTDLYTSPSRRILGGSQFAKSFKNSTVEEGCTSVFPPTKKDAPIGCTVTPWATVGDVPVSCIPAACLAPGVTTSALEALYTQFSQVPASALISPEQAASNVLAWYFNDTPLGRYFGSSTATAPMNYLQIYGEDFTYATTHTAKVAVIVGGITAMYSAQDILNLAASSVPMIAEH
jgi:hypothetical protein